MDMWEIPSTLLPHKVIKKYTRESPIKSYFTMCERIIYTTYPPIKRGMPPTFVELMN